jgi:hypothetical protein
MRYVIRFQFLLIGIFIFNLNTWAQYDASASLSLGMGHGYTALSQSVMTNAFAASSGKKVSKASNADYIYLGFSHYRGFEEKVFNQVLTNDKNVDKGKLRSFLTSTRTMHHFGTRAREYGLKDTYLSDIIATGIAWNWEMYHQAKPTTQKVVNLRDAIRSNMTKLTIKSQIDKMSEEDKRNWILSFMYNNSMLAQTIKNNGKVSSVQKQQLLTVAQQAGVPNIAKVSLK